MGDFIWLLHSHIWIKYCIKSPYMGVFDHETYLAAGKAQEEAEVFCKTGIPKNVSKFTEKHLYRKFCFKKILS